MIQLWRQAARSLAKRPLFSFCIVLIIALCIGGNAAVFSAAEAVLFRELPFGDADRMVVLTSDHIPTGIETDVSWAELVDWGKRSRLLEHVSPFLAWQDRLIMKKDSVERVRVNCVPSSFLKVMDAKPELGRLFTSQEDGPPGSAPVIILSHALWVDMFGRDPQILGKQIQLNDGPFTVVGVMPENFLHFLQWRFEPVDAWIPANMAIQGFGPDYPLYEARDERLWFGLARLKPGVTLEQAREEAAGIARQFEQEFPDTNKGYTAHVSPIREAMFPELHQGVEVLLGGAALVLLLGCANVANLLLVRMAAQRKEMSLRLTLGADRNHLIRYILAEGLLFAVLGGLLGMAFAFWGTRVLASLVELPAFTRIELDGRVLAVSAAVTLLTALLFSLPPILSVLRLDSKGALQRIREAGGRTHSSSRGLSGLLVFQVAVVVFLLIVSSLLLQSYWRLQAAGVGFKTAGLLTLRMDFGAERYDEKPNVSAAMAEIIRQVKAVPGIEDAALWGTNVPGISAVFTELLPDGAPETAPTIRADLHLISPGALKALGIPVLRGREFTPQDTYGVPRVAMVTQSLARLVWPNQDPVGKQLYRPSRENGARVTVVGVIPEVRFQGRFEDGTPHLLFPNTQVPGREAYLMVYTKADVTSITPLLKEAVRKVDFQIPVYDIVPMEQRLRREERPNRLSAAVVTSYSILALVLSLLGLYGILAYSVLQRTQEIGVRLALGARREQVLRSVMGRGAALVAGGVALGLVGAFLLSRLLSSQLYGIAARDPLSFTSVAILFIAVGLLATYLPARQASKVEPTVALRYD
jgi:putative ABC transport system permease protein